MWSLLWVHIYPPQPPPGGGYGPLGMLSRAPEGLLTATITTRSPWRGCAQDVHHIYTLPEGVSPL
jgi:hypothetical protein